MREPTFVKPRTDPRWHALLEGLGLALGATRADRIQDQVAGSPQDHLHDQRHRESERVGAQGGAQQRTFPERSGGDQTDLAGAAQHRKEMEEPTDLMACCPRAAGGAVRESIHCERVIYQTGSPTKFLTSPSLLAVARLPSHCVRLQRSEPLIRCWCMSDAVSSSDHVRSHRHSAPHQSRVRAMR
jgi:hypothetical protein